MRTLATDNGDLVFRIIDGLDSVIARVEQRLRFFRGSWFLNTQAGVPYLEDVLGQLHDPVLAQRVIIDAISGVADVTGVTDFEFITGAAAQDALDNPIDNPRPLLFRATVSTIYGEAEIIQ